MVKVHIFNYKNYKVVFKIQFKYYSPSLYFMTYNKKIKKRFQVKIILLNIQNSPHYYYTQSSIRSTPF